MRSVTSGRRRRGKLASRAVGTAMIISTLRMGVPVTFRMRILPFDWASRARSRRKSSCLRSLDGFMGVILPSGCCRGSGDRRI